MTTFEVKKFDMSSKKPSRCSLCIGQKGTGKSTLIDHLLYEMRWDDKNANRVDLALAISPSEESQKMFAARMGYSLVWTEFDVDKIAAIVEEQRHNRNVLDRPFKLAIFMDDMGFDESLWKHKTMLDLHFNQRHVDIEVVFSVQYVLSIKPDIRSNIDYVYAFNEKITKNRQKLYEHFFGVFANYASFDKTMRTCTENYECLVLDKTRPSSSLDDTVFYFRANTNLPSFKVGRPVFHEIDRAVRKKAHKKRPNIPGLGGSSKPDVVPDPGKITQVVKAKPKRSKRSKTPMEPLVLEGL